MDSWTIRRVLEWTTQSFRQRGLDSPRLDAELLLAHTLGIDRVGLYMDFDRPLVPEELAVFREKVQRRRLREPVAYIHGEWHFFGRMFEVGPAVLVPRPDTETLVSAALDQMGTGPIRVIDLCTGSGVIGVTLALERPQSHIDATDISPDALEVATRNARRHQVGARVCVRQGDLFEAASEGRYHVVVSNPPYIADGDYDDLQPEIVAFEPRQALVGGTDGMDFHRRLVDAAPFHLLPEGLLFIEVGAGQANAVAALCAADSRYEEAKIHNDFNGIGRVVEARVARSK